MKSIVQHVLSVKEENRIYSIDADDLVFNAIRIMSQKNIGALIVTGDSRIVGIVTERDYSRKIVLAKRSSTSTKVREIMSDDVMYITPDDSVEDCMALMTEKRVRHFPVISQGELVGVISQGDIVKALLSDREFTIDQLTRYIAGSYTEEVSTAASCQIRPEDRLIANY